MSASPVVSCVPPYPYQVFLNFRGEIRFNFISHLAKALKDENINIFIDENAAKGQHLDILFKEIEKSRIALAIFSEKYTESNWCLKELVKIKERMDEGKLVTIPIFYMVEPKTVKDQEGAFGDVLRAKKNIFGDGQVNKWVEALNSVSEYIGIHVDGKSGEHKFIEKIVQAVQEQLRKIPSEENIKSSLDSSQNSEVSLGDVETEIFGLKQRLEELNYKVKGAETRIIGVVGMHGIGKTTLLTKFYEAKQHKFYSHCLLQDIGEIVRFDPQCLNHNLPGMVLKKLLKHEDIDEDGYESYKEQLRKQKVFIVLDGITSKEQLDVLLKGHREWTLEGSKIIIATSDRSLLHDLVHDIYVVPQLDYRDGLKHFHHYALGHSAHADEAFLKLSKEFVHYVRGHPLTLELLGEELRGKSITHWEEKKKSLAQRLSPSIRDRVLQVSYDELNQEQKDAFLDIACFRSHDLVYVKSLVDSSGSDERNVIKSLTDKFLINTADTSLVEMHDLLHTFAREIGSKPNGKGRHQRGITNVLQNPGCNVNVKVKGIFLDLYQIKKDYLTLGKDHFKKMRGLRYLKFYSSHCPQECEPKEKIHVPDKLDFPLEEVRCLHWMKYPLEELPENFNPKNLVDLKLPYSKIRQIWNDKQLEAPKLKWVDLNHSSKLKTLSGLSRAQNLQRLNLEGCTALRTLAPYIQNMGSLIFLNLKGCLALESFPDIGLVPLKTLVLSNCSNLKSFLVISETLEALYLDGTAITELPTTMVKLVILNLQDCKKLERLPEGFDKLKDLQELVCSGCSILSCLPDAMENMKCLQILLLDGTAISKIPHISSLERISLRRNDNIIHLNDMSQFSQLKWLDLKYCKSLLSIPELPTNLQYLDAHGCVSLKAVANPLTTRMPMEQIHSTFIFTNCNKLDRNAKEEITTYAQRKCKLLSAPFKRYNEGFVPEALFSTCFPGCEVPSWFRHQEVGSELKDKLPAHWNEKRFVGIALCAVVSFPNSQEQVNSFSVTCKFNLVSKDGSPISFDRLVGRWNNHGNKLDKMESDHVFICYTRCSNDIIWLKGQSSTCIPTASSLEFDATNEKDKLEVIKCGLMLVYASEESHKVLMKKDNNGEVIELLQELTPTRNVSFNSITSGSSSSPGGNDIIEECQIGR